MRCIVRSRHAKFRSLIPVASAVLLLLGPAQGLGQYGRTFLSSPKLTPADIAIVRKLVREDLTGKPKGTTLSWSNPESENSGTVTLIDDFRSEGRDCRRVRYLINPGPKQASFARSSTYLLTSCRLSDGTWRIDNAAKRDTSR